MNLQPYLIQEDMSIMDALDIMEKNKRKVAFLCSENKLIGVVEDSDIRRYLLASGKLSDSIRNVINYNPIYINEKEQEDYKKFMINHAIVAVPIVNEKKEIIKIEFLYNIKQQNMELSDVPVVIMAGGKGVRLRPYTNILPKPLMPIQDKTITEHIIESYRQYGCKKFWMILNYKRELIKAYFSVAKQESEYELEFLEEQVYQGTGGGIKLLEQNMHQTFFLTNCDTLIYADYKSIFDIHKERKNIVTIVCAKKNMTLPYGAVIVDDNNQLRAFKEKPNYSMNVNTGMYIIEPGIFNYIKKNEFVHMTTIIQRLIDTSCSVGIYLVDESDWMDMGQLEELENIKNKLKL